MNFAALRADLTHGANGAAPAYGVGVLWTADRDFSRFPGLTVQNPLH